MNGKMDERMNGWIVCRKEAWPRSQWIWRRLLRIAFSFGTLLKVCTRYVFHWEQTRTPLKVCMYVQVYERETDGRSVSCTFLSSERSLVLVVVFLILLF